MPERLRIPEKIRQWGKKLGTATVAAGLVARLSQPEIAFANQERVADPAGPTLEGVILCPETASLYSNRFLRVPIAAVRFQDAPDKSRSVMLRLVDTISGQSGYVSYATPPRPTPQRPTEEPAQLQWVAYDTRVRTQRGENLHLEPDKGRYIAQVMPALTSALGAPISATPESLLTSAGEQPIAQMTLGAECKGLPSLPIFNNLIR